MGVNSLHWYYTPSLERTGTTVKLEGDEWHHCYHVMRMKTGDSLILVDGKGHCIEGMIKSSGNREGIIEVIRTLDDEYPVERNFSLSIGMAPTKNMDRTEFAVEKLVELGVDEITFLDCRHGERTHLRVDRLDKIVTAAAKQSRKIVFPVLKGMIPLADYLKEKQKERPGITILACHLEETSKSVFDNYSAGKDVVLLVGPEGGFSADELEMMKKEDVKFIHLGPHRLRVETAAIIACAGIHFIHQMKIKT